ncbi:MAG: hypothetical protein GX822_04280 [Alcaligenaceae bacterium]|jgi:hypothetical protein|nr:hypothetical protein [Alcaligenaceae bacterium]
MKKIKFKELPDGSGDGISGISHMFIGLNSWLSLVIVRLFVSKETLRVCYVVWVMCFLLTFIELYRINSLALGSFTLYLKRALILLTLTIVLYFFGRGSLPFFDESNETSQ